MTTIFRLDPSIRNESSVTRAVASSFYRAAGAQAGHEPARLRTASGGHVFVGRTSQEARDAYFPYYADYLSEAPQFANGMLMVGSPQQIIDGILHHHELLGTDRCAVLAATEVADQSKHKDPGIL